MLRNSILVILLCTLFTFQAGAQDRANPEATIRSFMTAIELGDVKQAVACVKGAQVSQADQDDLAQQFEKVTLSLTLRGVTATVDGTNAVVSGEFSIKEFTDKKRQTFNAKVSLVSSGGAWQIVPDLAKLQQTPNPDPVNSLAYMLTDPKVMLRSLEKASAITCVSNMKQMCLATLMLVQDWDEKFKLNASTFNKDLMPYLKTPAVFKCPSDTSGVISYSFNPKLAGISAAKVSVPGQTVLIYEGKNGKLEFRHDGKACIGFADGHAKLVDADGAKKLRWAP